MRKNRFLLMFLLASVHMSANSQTYMQIDCVSQTEEVTFLQKGDFAIAIPSHYEEKQTDSPDSNVWILKGDFGKINIDFGFKHSSFDKILPSTPCKDGGKLNIVRESNGTYIVTFISPHNDSFGVIFRIDSKDAELHGLIIRIISSFMWVGDPSKLQILETHVDNESVVLKNETGVPFESKVGDVVLRNRGVLKEIYNDHIVLEEYVFDNVKGEFRKHIQIVKKNQTAE